MISIEAYRASVGNFYAKMSCSNVSMFYLDDWRFFTCLLVQIAMLSLGLSSFVIAILLVMSGIETNPGPTYSFSKIVFASSNQGDSKYGDSAGTQCACMSLISACWALYKKCTLWSKLELDCILDQGDILFKNLGLGRSLFHDELPRKLTIQNCCFDIDHVAIETSEMRLNNTSFFKDHYKAHIENSNAIIFFVAGYSFSLLLFEKSFVLFDSHSHDEQGLYGEGRAISIRFSSIRQVHKYLVEKYLSLQHSILFQMLFVNVTCSEIERFRQVQSNALLEHQHAKRLQLKGTPEHTASLELRRMKRLQLKGTPEHTASLKKERTKRLQSKGNVKHDAILQKKQARRLNLKVTLMGKERNAKRKLETDETDYIAISSTPKKNLQQIEDHRRIETILFDCGDSRVKRFKEKIKEGPDYICVVCNRASYHQMFLKFYREKYNIEQTNFYFSIIPSSDGVEYICKTCDRKLRSREPKIPCQAVCNKLEIFDLPTSFKNINRLERVLISKRILFKKIVIMPKGQFPKVKGAICNVPVETQEVSKVLPRPAENNGLLLLKLKRKLEYRGHVYFEAVRPEMISRMLCYLKQNNHLYKDTKINLGNLPIELTFVDENNVLTNENVNLNPDSDDETLCTNTESDENVEEENNPLDTFRYAADETTMTSKIPISVDPDGVSIAPCQGKTPQAIFSDTFCEEMAFPHLFPTGKFGYKVDRNVQLSPTKYFNQRLLNYTQKFASDSDYIFFANHALQEIKLFSKITIAMKKVVYRNITAGMFNNNFRETVNSFVAQDQAFSFMNELKGTPAYWKRFLHEVLAMVKQLGIPTFFLTLSCADLRWKEIPAIISKLLGLELSNEELENLSYEDKCKYLNINPVFLARHFQYRVEVFFKEIVLKGPLGKIQYHVIRVEFQVRGSPHVHVFLWMQNPPVLSEANKEVYINFVDSVIRADIPDKETEPELFSHVKTYQVHTHSKTCRKYRNQPCRFNFGRYFCDRTIVALPLPNDIPGDDRDNILNKRKNILEKVKNYIDTNLFPKIRNILDPTKENYEEPEDIDTVLQTLGITSEEYYAALSISDDYDFQLHLRRPTNSCFVNNYFAEGLRAWEANMDIQPVFNEFKAVTYMCKYLSKSEDECSRAMKQALVDARETNLGKFDEMIKIAKAYASHRECSVQEAVYHVMPELWLRKCFPAVHFLNSNLPSERYRMCKNQKELAELPNDSVDVFKKNMLDRYLDRPNSFFMSGKYKNVDKMCYAFFLAYYYLDLKSNVEIVNDTIPSVLTDNLLEEGEHTNYPPILPLMNSKQKLKCRKVKAVLRFGAQNKHKNPEKYAHHLLFCYYPFRSEDELKMGSYIEKLNQPGVLDIVNENKQIIEPYDELVDKALENLVLDDVPSNLDAFGQQENEEVEDLLLNQPRNIDDDQGTSGAPIQSRIDIVSDNELFEKIRSLNRKQRRIFDLVYSWAKTYVKNRNAKKIRDLEPLYIFLTGEGGCGKSHLLKTIFLALTKVLLHKGGDPGKPRVLKLAPTGVAAINIDGTTIHSGLGIFTNRECFPLSDKMRTSLRNKLSEVCVVIVDEISMVSNILLLNIHLRLCEIFGVKQSVPFGGKMIIVCGDLFQLPPVFGARVYDNGGQSMLVKVLKLWGNFKLAQLTEIMRQRGDTVFIDLLNNVRIGELNESDIAILSSRIIHDDNPNYPHHALHLFAENAPVLEHNERKLLDLDGPMFVINAIDQIPRDVPALLIENALDRKQSETGGLAAVLKLKVGAKVMVTSNIDIDDRLINGQIGTVEHIVAQNGIVSKIYIQFQDPMAGLNKKSRDAFGLVHNFVPIERIETDIHIKKNIPSSPIIKRTQFPLKLSWACTVHKVQGLSLRQIVVSLQLFRQRSFNVGQLYVALSRVTTLDGLYLTGTFDKEAFKADKKAFAEYERLRSHCVLSKLPQIQCSLDSVTITLLNTRSLKKHVIDIKSDKNLMETDVLCLTETHILPNHDVEEINTQLDPLTVIYHNSQDKFLSTAVCYSNTVVIDSSLNVNDFFLFKLLKPTFSNTRAISVCLIYRKHSNSVCDFYDFLSEMLDAYEIDILLGDFNVDFFDDRTKERLMEKLELFDFVSANNESTHIDGGLLDHVYLKHGDLTTSEISLDCVYFSDHDAVKVKIIKK